jgi:hypothetical protein
MLITFLLGALVGSIATCTPSRLRLVKGISISDQCHANLVKIHSALEAWVDARGCLPLTLDELVRAGPVLGLVDEGTLRCPATGQRYIYLFEGVPVRGADLGRTWPLVACPGFPHGPSKFFGSWGSAWRTATEGSLMEGLEEDRVKLAELLAAASGTPPEEVARLRQVLSQGASSPSAPDSPGAAPVSVERPHHGTAP